MASEMADVIYFAMVKGVSAGVSWQQVERVLDRRQLKVEQLKCSSVTLKHPLLLAQLQLWF